MNAEITITSANSGASELACRIVTRLLSLDGFAAWRKRFADCDSYDLNGFAASCARMVDSELPITVDDLDAAQNYR